MQACNLDSEEMKNSEIDHAYQFTLYILDGAATLLILESCSGDVLFLRKSFAAKTRAETKKTFGQTQQDLLCRL